MSHAQYDPTPKAPQPWAQPAPAQGAGVARLLPVLGVVLGLMGLGMGVAAWFRAAPPDVAGKPVYTEQQVVDARTAVCHAYMRGMQSLQVAGAKTPDPTDWLPVAVNTRLAETAVGNYLINVMQANPAVPPDLKALTEKLALNYQEMAVIQLADKPTTEFASNNQISGELIPKINQLCQ
jgi:hypothetical protein